MGESRFTEEWFGGRFSVPKYFFADDGVPFRPEVGVWASSAGLLTVLPGDPESDDMLAVAALAQAMAEPEIGKPRRPRFVRVANEQLGELIRQSFPKLTVRVGATPELRKLHSAVKRRVSEMGTPLPRSYLTCGVAPETVAGFMEAAAAFYDSMLRVHRMGKVVIDVPAFDLRGAEAIYLRPRFLPRYRRIWGVCIMSPCAGSKPPDLTLGISFQEARQIPDALRREVVRYGWRVAQRDAYPSIRVLDGKCIDRVWTEHEARLAWACLDGLARVNLQADEMREVGAHDELFDEWRMQVQVRGAPGRPLVRMKVSAQEPFKFGDRMVSKSDLAPEPDACLVRDFARRRKGGRVLVGSLLTALYEWRKRRNKEDESALGVWTPPLVDAWMFDALPKRTSPDVDELVHVPRILREYFGWLAREGKIDPLCAEQIREQVRRRARAFLRHARDQRNWSECRRHMEEWLAEQSHKPAPRGAADEAPRTGPRLITSGRTTRTLVKRAWRKS